MSAELNRIKSFDDLLSKKEKFPCFLKESENKKNEDKRKLEEYLYKNDLINLKHISYDNKVKMFLESIKDKEKPEDIFLIQKRLKNLKNNTEKFENKYVFDFMKFAIISSILGYGGFFYFIVQAITGANFYTSLIKGMICLISMLLSTVIVKNRQIKIEQKKDEIAREKEFLSMTQGEYIYLRSKTPDENFNNFLVETLLENSWSNIKIEESLLTDYFFDPDSHKDYIADVFQRYTEDENETKLNN